MPNTEPMNSPAKKKMLYKSYISSISARSYEPEQVDAGGQLDALLTGYGIMGDGIRASRIFSQDKENGFVALTDVSNEAILNRLRSGEVLLISDSSGFPRSLSAMQLDGTEYLQCMSPEEALSFHTSRDQYFADKAEIIPPEEPDLLTIICNFFVELLFGHYSKGMQEWIQYRDLFMKQEGIDTFMHSEAVTARQTEADRLLQEQVRMIQQQQEQEQMQEQPQPQQEQQPLPQEVSAPAEQNVPVEANENIEQKENVSEQKEENDQQKDEQQAEGEEEKKEEEQPIAESEEIEPVEKKEEPVVEDKKEESVVEDKKEESVVEEKKNEPAAEDKKDEPAAEVKKDEPVTEVKKDEKPAVYNPIVAYSKDTTVLREQLKMVVDYQKRTDAATQMLLEKQRKEREKEELLEKQRAEKRRLDEEKEKKKWADAIKKSEEIDPDVKGEQERIKKRDEEFSKQVREEKRRKERAEKLARDVERRERREAREPLKTSEDYAREQRRLDKLLAAEKKAREEHRAFEKRLAELQQKRLELMTPERVKARSLRLEQLNRMMVERDMPLAYLAKVCFENRENEFEANVPKRMEDLKADQRRRDEDYRARLREFDRQWEAASTEKEKKAIDKKYNALDKEYKASDDVYEKERKNLEKTIEKERATLKDQFAKYQKVFDKKGADNEAALLKALPEDVRKRVEEKRAIDLTGVVDEIESLGNEEKEYYELGKLEEQMKTEEKARIEKELADSIRFARQYEERMKETYGPDYRKVMMKEAVQNKKDLEDAAKRSKEIAERNRIKEEQEERQFKFLKQCEREILRANADEYWDNHAMDEQNEMSEKNEKKEKEVNKGKGGPVKGM